MTPKQKEFARLVVARQMSKADAYRKAFSKGNISNSAASKAASRLMKKDEVQAFLSKLDDTRDGEAILSRDTILQRIVDIAVSAERVSDSLRAYELYSKVAGYHQAPPVTNVEVNVMQCSFSSVLTNIVAKTRD